MVEVNKETGGMVLVWVHDSKRFKDCDGSECFLSQIFSYINIDRCPLSSPAYFYLRRTVYLSSEIIYLLCKLILELLGNSPVPNLPCLIVGGGQGVHLSWKSWNCPGILSVLDFVLEYANFGHLSWKCPGICSFPLIIYLWKLQLSTVKYIHEKACWNCNFRASRWTKISKFSGPRKPQLFSPSLRSVD